MVDRADQGRLAYPGILDTEGMMAKYINKDQAYKIVLHYGSYVASTKIADLPSIDLVTCAECRHDCKVRDDWYCADGERKVQE